MFYFHQTHKGHEETGEIQVEKIFITASYYCHIYFSNLVLLWPCGIHFFGSRAKLRKKQSTCTAIFTMMTIIDNVD
jgi:hypothetical protein